MRKIFLGIFLLLLVLVVFLGVFLFNQKKRTESSSAALPADTQFLEISSSVPGVKLAWRDGKALETVFHTLISRSLLESWFPPERRPQIAGIRRISITLVPNELPQSIALGGTPENPTLNVASGDYKFEGDKLSISVYLYSAGQIISRNRQGTQELDRAFTEKLFDIFFLAVPPPYPGIPEEKVNVASTTSKVSWSPKDTYQEISSQSFSQGYPIHLEAN